MGNQFEHEKVESARRSINDINRDFNLNAPSNLLLAYLQMSYVSVSTNETSNPVQ